MSAIIAAMVIIAKWVISGDIMTVLLTVYFFFINKTYLLSINYGLI
jgi:hypothetical protein